MKLRTTLFGCGFLLLLALGCGKKGTNKGQDDSAARSGSSDSRNEQGDRGNEARRSRSGDGGEDLAGSSGIRATPSRLSSGSTTGNAADLKLPAGAGFKEKAIAYYAQGKIKKALREANNYHTQMERKFGEKAPETLEALNTYALLEEAEEDDSDVSFQRRQATRNGVPYSDYIPGVGLGLEPGGSELAEATDLLNRLTTLQADGEYDQALLLARRIRSIYSRKLGNHHPQVATAYVALAEIHQGLNELKEADEALKEASNLLKEFLDSIGEFTTNVPVNVLEIGARTQRAKARLLEVDNARVALARKRYGEEHLEVAAATQLLAIHQFDFGLEAEAEATASKAKDIAQKHLGGPEATRAKELLETLEGLHGKKTIQARAEEIAEQAGADAPQRPKISSLNLEAAGASSSTGSAIFRSWQPPHPRVKQTTEATIKTMNATISQLEKQFGKDSPALASPLESLGGLYYTVAKFHKARDTQRRAITLKEKSLGKSSADLGPTLVSLGQSLTVIKDYKGAKAAFDRAMRIYEKAYGPEHTAYLGLLDAQAHLFVATKEFDKAAAALERAQALAKKMAGEGNPMLVPIRAKLAEVHRLAGEAEKSAAVEKQALEGLELVASGQSEQLSVDHVMRLSGVSALYIKSFEGMIAELEANPKIGPKHPETLTMRHNLGILHYYRGETKAAIRELTRAEKGFEERLGPYHPYTSISLDALSVLYQAKGDIKTALKLKRKTLESYNKNLFLVIANGTEEQKQDTVAALVGNTHHAVSLHLQSAPRNPRAADLALETVLRRKGRILDAMADAASAIQQGLGPEGEAMQKELKEERARLATLMFEATGANSDQKVQKAQLAAQAKVRKLEQQLANMSGAEVVNEEKVNVRRVQQAIPPGAALVEYIRYRPFNPKLVFGEDPWGAPRYAACVLRRKGRPKWVDLGSGEAVDNLIGNLRLELANPNYDPMATSRNLDALVFEALEPHLGKAEQVFVAPDGALNLLPFGALQDEKSHYRIERFTFTYLSSGRDLLRLKMAARGVDDKGVIVGNPQFNQIDEVDTPTEGASPAASRTSAQSRGSGQSRVAAYALQFSALPGTEKEIAAISEVWKDASLLEGGQASEAAVKALDQPAFLHIASHGFFLSSLTQTGGGTRGIKVTAPKKTAKAESPLAKAFVTQLDNPLLRSGIALAGANRGGVGGENGILTALEGAGLKLNGTRLVTLSACETGVGQIVEGEGVYGLRRAFVIAGARAQLMSLWQVDDIATRDLMIAFYKRLKEGKALAESLRFSQLEMLKGDRRQHPYYWASFIQSGDWRRMQ